MFRVSQLTATLLNGQALTVVVLDQLAASSIWKFLLVDIVEIDTCQHKNFHVDQFQMELMVCTEEKFLTSFTKSNIL